MAKDKFDRLLDNVLKSTVTLLKAQLQEEREELDHSEEDEEVISEIYENIRLFNMFHKEAKLVKDQVKDRDLSGLASLVENLTTSECLSKFCCQCQGEAEIIAELATFIARLSEMIEALPLNQR